LEIPAIPPMPIPPELPTSMQKPSMPLPPVNALQQPVNTAVPPVFVEAQ